jgi:hypothetical protein
LRVMGAGIGGDAQIGAEEGGSEFGDLSRQLDDQTPQRKTASSVFGREHDRENACCFFGVSRIFGAVLHRLVEAVMSFCIARL